MKSISATTTPTERPADEAELVKYTSTFWSERYGREVSAEEAREIVANITGFFSILLEWEKQAKSAPLPE